MKDTAKKPILVIMAAGMGSRFGGLKQIEAVGPAGEAILDYSLFDAHRAGFETVVFIIKHAIEDAFKSTVGARAEKAGLNVRYAYQELDMSPRIVFLQPNMKSILEMSVKTPLHIQV